VFQKFMAGLIFVGVGMFLCNAAGCSGDGGSGDQNGGGGDQNGGGGDQNGGGSVQAGTEQEFAGMTFIYCPAGTFTMGSDHEEWGQDDETPHQVTLSQGFWIAKYELTQSEWEAVMGSNPSLERHQGPNRPVDSVSWEDAQDFITALNADSGESFRLPTESEWEYACRAGTTTEFSFGDDPGDFDSNYKPLVDYAWWSENSDTEVSGQHISHDVGLLLPNGWGIYDMHGNNREWVQDLYGEYPAGPVTDPQGPDDGDTRVNRGGAAWHLEQFLRSARRTNNGPKETADDRGFRLVRPE